MMPTTPGPNDAFPTLRMPASLPGKPGLGAELHATQLPPIINSHATAAPSAAKALPRNPRIAAAGAGSEASMMNPTTTTTTIAPAGNGRPALAEGGHQTPATQPSWVPEGVVVGLQLSWIR